MSYASPTDPERPRMIAVYDSARFMTLYGTPLLLAGVGLYLNTQAFSRSPAAGLRSLAATAPEPFERLLNEGTLLLLEIEGLSPAAARSAAAT